MTFWAGFVMGMAAVFLLLVLAASTLGDMMDDDDA